MKQYSSSVLSCSFSWMTFKLLLVLVLILHHEQQQEQGLGLVVVGPTTANAFSFSSSSSIGQSRLHHPRGIANNKLTSNNCHEDDQTTSTSSSSSTLYLQPRQGQGVEGEGHKQEINEQRNYASSTTSTTITHSCLAGKRILVIGGSGRVGGSVVCQLVKHGAKVTVGGTKLESFQKSKSRWIQLYSSDKATAATAAAAAAEWKDDLESVLFELVDREDDVLMNKILKSDAMQKNGAGRGYDLVVHTAGPFQGKVKCPNGILKACIESGVGYIDVCDDYCTACAAKAKYASMAKERGVPCIVSTGCWPGVSSLMAKQLTRNVLEQKPHLQAEDLTVDFSFFTAGSGGAGATLLVATFLILAEKSLVIVNGRRKSVPAMKEYSQVDFGDYVGKKDVGHLNLLEAASCHDILGIGNVKTLFGTAPSFWNTLLGVMAQFPSSWLSNEALMERLAIFSLPIVRVVDYFAGATNAMRVDVSCQKDPTVKEMALYAHENLEPCVGECVSAFCAALLNGSVKPGVSFPEEAIDTKEDVAAVLALASVGAHTLEVKVLVG